MMSPITSIAEFATPQGHRATFEYRPDTTDWNTVNACCTEDEYGFGERSWEGTALDVGAHIGGVTIGLLIDNPALRVIALEALPENRELIRHSLLLNGLSERCEVIDGAASGRPGIVPVAYGSRASEFEEQHYWIGGLLWHQEAGDRLTTDQEGFSLSHLVETYGHIALLKIDCEGCEWEFLDDAAVQAIDEIRGEYHPRNGNGPDQLLRLLSQTHDVTLNPALDFGPFKAVRRGV